MISIAVRRFGLLLASVVFAGCTQVTSLVSPTAVSIPPADFAFVQAGKIQTISLNGEVTVTDIAAADSLPAVSNVGTRILYAEMIADKYQLMLWQTDTNQTEPITALAALPTQLMFSDDEDLALMIVEQQLYLVFIPQYRLVRVHEGVEVAGFSASNQRIEYRTTDQRLLSREFAVDGSLADAKALAADPFADLVIQDRPDTRMAGWSKHGLGVYYVDIAGEVTLVEYE